MATNITLSFFGPPEQKHVIKVPPMQTLAQALAAAASKFRPALVPSNCTLVYNKKPVDLGTPFRLLNVPAGSRLEVVISSPQQPTPSAASAGTAVVPVGAPQQQATTPAAPASALTTAGPAAAAAAPGSQPASVATAAGAALIHQAQPPAAQAAAAQDQASPPAAAEPHQPPLLSQAAPSAAPSAAHPSASAAAAAAAAAAALQPPAPSDAGVGPSSAAAQAAEAHAPSPLAALGVEGQVFVFHQRTLEAAAATAAMPMEVDPPDDFFELTPDDLVRLQQGASAKKRAEAMFKPRALREAEEAAQAAALGPVRMRLHFPDATIVQASFNASQPLSAVQQLVQQLALPALVPGLYLYTTPPKTVLKDPTATLYQLRLVPAAHVYVGFDPKRLKPAAAAAAAGASSHPGPFLKPEVMALMQDAVPGQQQQQQGQQQGQQQPEVQPGAGGEVSVEEAQAVMAQAAAASRAEAAGSRAAAGGTGAKVPKWLKMGKQ